MQEAPEIDPQPAPQGKETTCQNCKTPFTPKTRKGVYCSPKCRQASFFQRRHNFIDLFFQIRKEFKNQTSKCTDKETLYNEIDELTNEWSAQLRALVMKAVQEHSNVANVSQKQGETLATIQE